MIDLAFDKGRPVRLLAMGVLAAVLMICARPQAAQADPTGSLVSAAVVAAEDSDFEQGVAAGKADAPSKFFTGFAPSFLCGVIGFAVQMGMGEDDPPTAAFLAGKSASWLSGYRHGYKKEMSGSRRTGAWTGCVSQGLLGLALSASGS